MEGPEEDARRERRERKSLEELTVRFQVPGFREVSGKQASGIHDMRAKRRERSSAIGSIRRTVGS
jgi:hypothetical protein